jgi:hypothetical protein
MKGEKWPALEVCDFHAQRGIYILYDDYGPYYVGLTRGGALGTRLQQHRADYHKEKWDRFSWFGFRSVLRSQLADGTAALGRLPASRRADTRSAIRDLEALLIQALGTQHRGNARQEPFTRAEHWAQVMMHETDHYLDHLERPTFSRARERETRRRATPT